jgi:hypothetical protein
MGADRKEFDPEEVGEEFVYAQRRGRWIDSTVLGAVSAKEVVSSASAIGPGFFP